ARDVWQNFRRLQRGECDLWPDRVRRACRHLQSRQRRRAWLRGHRRGDRHGSANATMRGLPATHLGILRGCPRHPVQSEGQKRSDADACSFSQAFRLLEPLISFHLRKQGRVPVNHRIQCVGVLLSGLLVLVPASTGQSKKEKIDVLVLGGTVVTMDAQRHTLEDAALAIKGDAIVAVGPRSEIDSKYAATAHVDGRKNLILPGLINGHTHAPMTLLRGLKDDVTLDVWLKNYIFPAEAKNVNEDFVRWGTRLA